MNVSTFQVGEEKRFASCCCERHFVGFCLSAVSSKLEIGLNEGLDFLSRVERSDLLVVVVKDIL